MFRLKANTPSSAGRRSTRSARGSAKRRRSDGSRGRGGSGGLKRKFEVAAQKPAEKWVKLWRPPSSKISFQVATWVRYAALTEEERLEYEAKREKEAQLKLQQQLEEEREAAETDEGEGVQQGIMDFEHIGYEEAGAHSNNPVGQDVEIAMSDGAENAGKRPVEVDAGEAEEEGPSTKRTKIEVPVEPSTSDEIAIAAPQDQPPTISYPAQPSQDEVQGTTELTTQQDE